MIELAAESATEQSGATCRCCSSKELSVRTLGRNNIMRDGPSAGNSDISLKKAGKTFWPAHIQGSVATKPLKCLLEEC